MNLNDAINNISQVLFVGRIEMPNGSLTAQEHQGLNDNFNLLVSRAQLAGKLEKELADAKELIKVYESKEQEPDEVPEVPDEEEVK